MFMFLDVYIFPECICANYVLLSPFERSYFCCHSGDLSTWQLLQMYNKRSAGRSITRRCNGNALIVAEATGLEERDMSSFPTRGDYLFITHKYRVL